MHRRTIKVILAGRSRPEEQKVYIKHAHRFSTTIIHLLHLQKQFKCDGMENKTWRFFYCNKFCEIYRVVVQLVLERHIWDVEVVGSSPAYPTRLGEQPVIGSRVDCKSTLIRDWGFESLLSHNGFYNMATPSTSVTPFTVDPKGYLFPQGDYKIAQQGRMGRYQSGQMGLTVDQVLRLRRFESSPSHKIGSLIQWFRMPPLQGGGRRFESYRNHMCSGGEVVKHGSLQNYYSSVQIRPRTRDGCIPWHMVSVDQWPKSPDCGSGTVKDTTWVRIPPDTLI